MRQTTSRTSLLAASILTTLIFLRIALYISPNSNFTVEANPGIRTLNA
jgi:uncharacterized PurR-regulated membrane protein YhhQ (DUF165 family)